MAVQHSALIGETVDGKFEIIELVGSGGWSVVYRARHRGLDRTVAFKVLRADLVSTAEKIQRFEKEAKLASSLNHPNICAVYDYGILSSGQPYLVLEFLSGVNFAQLIHAEAEARNSLPVDRVVALMKDAVAALSAAHSKGIIHRDLKPSNLMLVEENGHETLKIIDFGLAKTFGAEQTKDLTQTGLTIGTPAYMSPEQVQGLPLDARCDIYAFGCVFYELLTGKQAVIGKTMFETMQNQIELDPVFPESNGALPEALKELTLTCLRKDPSRRYQSMAEIAEDLESFSKSGKLRNRHRGVLRFVGAKHNQMVGLAAVMLTVLCVLAITFAASNQRLGKTNQDDSDFDAQISKFERLSQDADFADTKSAKAAELRKARFDVDRIIYRLKKDGRERTLQMARAAQVMRKFLEKSDHRLATVPYLLLEFEAQKSAVPVGSDRYLELHKEVALAVQNISQNEAIPLLRQWLALAEKKFGKDHKEIVQPLGALSWALFKSGHNEEAERNYLRHVAMAKMYYGEKDNLLVTDYGAIAWLYCNMKEYEKAREVGQKGIALLSDAVPAGTQQDLVWTTAIAEQKCRNFADAERLFRKALEISSRSDAAEANEILGGLGHCLYQAGKYSEAETVLLEAIPKISKSLGTQTAVYRLCLDDYVQLLRRTDRPREADRVEARGAI
jgi:serine/threonine protein kinase